MDFFKEPDNSLNLLLWLNQRSNSIHRSIIPGLSYTSTVEQSDKIELKNGRKPDRAITVDWIHNLLYFFEKDSKDKKLFNLVVCTVDGRYPKTLLHKAFEDPRDAVVDPINGLVNYNNVKFHKLIYLNFGKKISKKIFASVSISRFFRLILLLKLPSLNFKLRTEMIGYMSRYNSFVKKVKVYVLKAL